jgi:predicted nucleic acid-binding protein
MPFVVDPSFAAAWFLDDEANPLADELAKRLDRDVAVVPTLFRHELRNLLIVAFRRKRIATQELLFDQLARAERFAFEENQAPHAPTIARFALEHRLTGYDATYLELAHSRRLPLATNDRALLAAARSEGVEIITALT